MKSHRFAIGLAVLIFGGGASAAVAQVKLEYKYPEETSSGFKSTTKTDQVLTLNGMDIETKSEEVVTGKSTTGKRGADGRLPIETTINSVRMHLELPGNTTIDYDTTDPNAKIELPQLAFLSDVLKVLAGSTFTIVLDDKNKVQAVEGADAIMEKAKALDPKVSETLKGRFELERMKREHEKQQGRLPMILVREGEPWEQTEVDDIGGNQTLTFRRQYEYKGATTRDGRTLDKIGIKALDVKYQMAANADSPLKALNSDLKIDSSDGEMLFDRALGTVVERKDNTRIKGDMTFKSGETELPAKLDLTFNTLVTRENEKK